jgi:hypothetical protein
MHGDADTQAAGPSPVIVAACRAICISAYLDAVYVLPAVGALPQLLDDLKRRSLQAVVSGRQGKLQDKAGLGVAKPYTVHVDHTGSIQEIQATKQVLEHSRWIPTVGQGHPQGGQHQELCSFFCSLS